MIQAINRGRPVRTQAQNLQLLELPIMTAQPAERLWTLDQALLWYATRDVDLVQAASRRLPPEKRLMWMDWVLSSAEPMREEDAQFRRGRRLAGITDPEPELEGGCAVPWRVTAQELHDLFAENPSTLQIGGEPLGAEWFEHGEFGYGRDGARLVRARPDASYRSIAAGSGLEALEPLVRSEELVVLVEGEEVAQDSASERIGPKRRIVLAAVKQAFPNGPPSPDEMDNQTFVSKLSLPKEPKIDRITILRAVGRAR